ncbi:hypothetical protein IWX49DRAFT_404026 [Phyllosticta citricarpa]
MLQILIGGFFLVAQLTTSAPSHFSTAPPAVSPLAPRGPKPRSRKNSQRLPAWLLTGYTCHHVQATAMLKLLEEEPLRLGSVDWLSLHSHRTKRQEKMPEVHWRPHRGILGISAAGCKSKKIVV